MWMLTDLQKQNEVAMTELGLLIPANQIYNPDGIALKDAVVHFGGGCTGEVISAEGLVLTNHHCGYGAIQQHSSVEHDYLTDGFWAMSREEELPCKGLTVTYIDRILDVTDYVNEQLKTDDDPNGTNYLSPKYLKTVADRFAKSEGIALTPGRKLELKAFYGGNRYYLFVKTTYSDIRMVGAPPSSIGKFGADTDNWMWPRHTGDFSIFRIYADKDGKPAAYSKDNVPLKVKKHLTISLDGYRKGDFTFVMGFPGRNWRYMISDEVEERMQTTNFMRHHVRDVRQESSDETNVARRCRTHPLCKQVCLFRQLLEECNRHERRACPPESTGYETRTAGTTSGTWACLERQFLSKKPRSDTRHRKNTAAAPSIISKPFRKR